MMSSNPPMLSMPGVDAPHVVSRAPHIPQGVRVLSRERGVEVDLGPPNAEFGGRPGVAYFFLQRGAPFVVIGGGMLGLQERKSQDDVSKLCTRMAPDGMSSRSPHRTIAINSP